nr:unnamed protein product [Spirometra erinaceieuropaei]
MPDNRLLRVDDQAEFVASDSEEIHAPLYLSIGGGVEGEVVREENFVDGGYEYARLEVHPPLIDKVTVRPVGEADPRRSSREASISMADNIRLKRVSVRTRPCFTPMVTANASETAPLPMPSWK